MQVEIWSFVSLRPVEGIAPLTNFQALDGELVQALRSPKE